MKPALNLKELSPDQLRELAEQLLRETQQKDEVIATRDRRIQHVELENGKLKHELAILKLHKFARTSEALNSQQCSLLDDLVNEDIAAIEEQLARHEQLLQAEPKQKQIPRRAPLPGDLPRTLTHHEPDTTRCDCDCELRRIGEDIREKLDYIPGTFTIERHIRGKWACPNCETFVQTPVPPQVIDKGIPAPGLLAQVLVAKYGDHLPLYRQERIFARAGVEPARSTLADWVGRCGVALQPLVDRLRELLHQQDVLHADETPVSMLEPGKKKTHKAYVWAYTSTAFLQLNAVIYDFAPGRSGEGARSFLCDWQGKLVCDDFSGYKASFRGGIVEIGCMAHACRKFFDLHMANQSTLAQSALEQIGKLYDIERLARDMDDESRLACRQQHAK
ncbi:Transposase [Thalassolituus maritimus]|uniref:Transposase n=1 Tax=Thalassolituus maritimus TaxID=484498 RepID=A0A1N7QCV4_9GAMM|nr:Transposase [Thalassolituus maritimus]